MLVTGLALAAGACVLVFLGNDRLALVIGSVAALVLIKT